MQRRSAEGWRLVSKTNPTTTPENFSGEASMPSTSMPASVNTLAISSGDCVRFKYSFNQDNGTFIKVGKNLLSKVLVIPNSSNPGKENNDSARQSLVPTQQMADPSTDHQRHPQYRPHRHVCLFCHER